jgi:arginine deiminase
MNPLNVRSEIAPLKKVLLHRVGREVENLTPDILDRLLFDDIPYLEIAQKEHDTFAKLLEDHGVEVVYLEDQIAEVIKDDNLRRDFIEQFLDEGRVFSPGERSAVKDYFFTMNNSELINTMMAGVRKREVPKIANCSLNDMVDSDYPFILDPMPNLYFTRDPFATIGRGVSLNHMRTDVRNRETIFSEYIFKYHPDYKNYDIPFWFDKDNTSCSLEGGDELILNNKVLAMGISHRTDAAAIEEVAKKLLYDEQETFERILAFKIPDKRAFMHLDTVFTMVDYDKFTIHAQIEGELKVFSITKGNEDVLKIDEEEDTLENILKKYLELDQITLIKCAGGDEVDAGREQWSDGSNTLAIAPGEVIVYSRNHVTNKLLEENGVKLHVIPSSELSRGRGGPRCMSMPLIREEL